MYMGTSCQKYISMGGAVNLPIVDLDGFAEIGEFTDMLLAIKIH